MIKTLILICGALVPHADCSIDTARAVIQGPDVVVCSGRLPLELLASTVIRPDRHAEYLKILCEDARP